MAYIALAMLDYSQGDRDGAITALERSVRLAPEGSDTSSARSLLGQMRDERARRGSGPKLSL